MKRVIVFLSILIAVVFSANAQPPKLKSPKQNKWIDDSLLWVKQPTQVNVRTNQRSSNRVKSAKPVNKTKLDDLKNPFDTGKVRTVRRVNNYIGETEKN